MLLVPFVRDKQIEGFEADTIVKVAFELDDGTQVVANRADVGMAFTLEGLADGETLKVGGITKIVSKFATIFATNARALDDADAQAAKDHSRLFKFTDKDGAVHTYRVGRRPAATSVAAKATEDDENNLGVEQQAEEESKPGPVFVFASSSDEAIQVELERYMSKASFEIAEHFYDDLPKIRTDLIEEMAFELPSQSTPIEFPLPPESVSAPMTE